MDSEYQHHMENPLKSLNGLPKRANAFTLCQPAQVPGACLLQGLPDKRFSCFQQTGSYQHFHPCLQTCENDVTKFCEEQSGWRMFTISTLQNENLCQSVCLSVYLSLMHTHSLSKTVGMLKRGEDFLRFHSELYRQSTNHSLVFPFLSAGVMPLHIWPWSFFYNLVPSHVKASVSVGATVGNKNQ